MIASEHVFVILLLLPCLSVNLMGLLKWRDNPRGLETYLRLFMKVDGEEIVKVEESFTYNFSGCISGARFS